MGIFDKVIQRIHDLSSSLIVKESLDSLATVYPDNYTWEDIANELNTGTLVPGILIALTLPGRLKYSSADETYRAVVEKTISKAILPIEAENESKLFSLWFSVPFSPT